MSDVRFNQWLHQSGTGGVSQVSGGHVGIGTTNPEIAVHSGNTKVLNVGIVTASTYYGNGANLTGLSGGGTGLDLNDNIKVRLGNSQDLQLYHDGSHSYIDDAGTGNLRLRSGTLEITNAAGSKTSAVFNSGSSQDLYFNNTKRFETLNDGIRVSGHIYANDNQYLKLGTSQDLKIYHDGSNSLVNADGTGNLIIQGANDIILRPADGEVGIDINANGGVNLYYDNSIKLGTAGWGIQATGILKIVDATDSSGATNHLAIGASNDLKLFHDGSNTYILNSTGFLNIKTTGGGAHYIDADDQYFRTSGGENLVRMIGDGAVELYHDNVKQIQTTANGVGFVNNCTFSDSKKIQMGDANDLQLYHDGSNSISFIDTTNGNLRIRVANGENAIQCKANNAVELYHNNTKRIETTANGIEVTGAGTGNYFNAGANALNTTFQSNYGGAGATSVIRVKMNTSSVHGIQIQQAGSSTSVAGGNHAATFFNTENAKLRLGTNNGEQFRIENNGDLKANDTSIGSLSDSRLKKNIVDFTYDLNKFKQFKPKTFDWINPELHGNKSNVRGFVAQEIEVVDSTLVGDYELYDETLTDKNPDLAIIKADDGTNIAKDSKLGTNDAMYISVIQQLMTKIETLETENTDLKNLIKNSSSFAALKSSL